MKVSIRAVTVLREAATIPCFLNCPFLLLLNSCCEAASNTAYLCSSVVCAWLGVRKAGSKLSCFSLAI